MASLSFTLAVALLLLLLHPLGSNAQPKPKPKPKPKTVMCRNKAFPFCYLRLLSCPDACPSSCHVDCQTCMPVCDPITKPKPEPKPKPKVVKCQNKSFPFCYLLKHTCPLSCPYSCQVDCLRCAPVCDCNLVGGVCQDPRFVGGDGRTFYFHGRSNGDFCILSDPNIHINAHFIGRRNMKNTRDHTWVQSLGIIFGSHRVYIGALNTSTWDDNVDRLSISFDGEQIFLPQEEGAKWSSGDEASIVITRVEAANRVVVEVRELFRIAASVVPITAEESRVHSYGITAEDCFAHLELGFKFHSLSEDVHGVLGKTYRSDYVSPFKASADMPVVGGAANFASSGIFATDCRVSRFAGGDAAGVVAAF